MSSLSNALLLCEWDGEFELQRGERGHWGGERVFIVRISFSHVSRWFLSTAASTSSAGGGVLTLLGDAHRCCDTGSAVSALLLLLLLVFITLTPTPISASLVCHTRGRGAWLRQSGLGDRSIIGLVKKTDTEDSAWSEVLLGGYMVSMSPINPSGRLSNPRNSS